MSRSRLIALVSVAALFLVGVPMASAAAATLDTVRIHSVKLMANGAGVRLGFVVRCHKSPEAVVITATLRQAAGNRIASGSDYSRIFTCKGHRQVVHMVVGANDAPFRAGVALLK